jgi:hypothetical protein
VARPGAGAGAGAAMTAAAAGAEAECTAWPRPRGACGLTRCTLRGLFYHHVHVFFLFGKNISFGRIIDCPRFYQYSRLMPVRCDGKIDHEKQETEIYLHALHVHDARSS